MFRRSRSGRRRTRRTRSEFASCLTRRRSLFEALEDRMMLAADLDTNLTLFEPYVVVNPTDPTNIVASQFNQIAISTDYGETFGTPVNATLPPALQAAGYGFGGDSVLAFDAPGTTLYWAYLATLDSDGDGNNEDQTVVVQRVTPKTGAQIGTSIDLTPGNFGDDKPWITVDDDPQSPFAGNVYVVWTRLDGNPDQLLFSRSTDGGVNFSAPMLISDPNGVDNILGNGDDEEFVWPSHVETAPNGDLYVAYHIDVAPPGDGDNPNGGPIVVLRSSNGGADLAAGTVTQKSTAFPAGTAQMNDNVQTEATTIAGSAFWTLGTFFGDLLADPLHPGRIYIVGNDDPNNAFGNGDEGDVVFAISEDYGVTWSAPKTISHGPTGTLQVFPIATIDELGNIAVMWYDNRNGATNAASNFLLDVYATVSRDGGLTFSNDFRINDAPFDPDLNAPQRFAGPPPTLRIGEYNGIAASQGVVHLVWTGNDTGNMQQEVFYDQFNMLGPFADPWEENDSLATATILGSLPKITIKDATLDNPSDVDYYKYTAQDTGKLIVNALFNDEVANLRLRVLDSAGNVIDTGTQSPVVAGLDIEGLVIPVVTQEEYWIEVSYDPTEIIGNPLVYDLEVENFAAPAPAFVDLVASSDTGMMNNDNVTSDTTPTFLIQADLVNFRDMGITLLNQAVIDPNNDGNAGDATDDGAGVYVSLINLATGLVVDGFAIQVGVAGFLWTFTSPMLTSGEYFVSAAVQIVDGQQDPSRATGRAQLSDPLIITIESDSPVSGTFDLLSSSDTGMFNDDNVTNKMQPAFSGQGPANSKVHVFAQPTNAMGMPVGNPLLVGEGVVGSDATDGILDNGLGLWEVTVEPVADGKYNFFARFETAAGILGDPVALTTAVTYLGGPNVIPDGGMLTTQVTVPTGAMPLPIVDVNVRINVMHTNDEDLDITLIAPDGTEVLLTSDNGGSGDNYTNTVFDDAAGISITAGVAPFSGTFRPEVALAGLNGKEASGDWMLRIVDDTMNESEGTLIDWSLTIQTPLMIVIDTVEPNTPYLDLLDDTGRSDVDNITKDNTPMVSMTTTDPNIAFSQLLFTDNLKFRIFDRFENSAQEVLIYDSAQDVAADNIMTPNDMFTALTQITRTLPVLTPASPAITAGGMLADGVHNLKLEVEDRAGNISHDFLLSITVDTVTPPVSFGLPAAASQIDGLTAESDTGVTTMPMTYADRVTSDTTPRMWGRAEANTIVRLYLDQNANGVIDLLTDTYLGQTVAVPFDGNDAYPDGYWEITSALDLNEIVGLPKDGLRRLLVTAEDVAGNPMPMNNVISQGVDELQIFIDTQGPQIFEVTVNNLTTAEYDLFDPKPSVTGYTPLVNSLRIHVQDFPIRIDQAGTINDFLYDALKLDIAQVIGNYQVVGDHVGPVVIQRVDVTQESGNGFASVSLINLVFATPLPDDRFTLMVRDNLVDPAGNKLDGESNAQEPTDVPTFPTGDGVPGGDFVARFTVDSRPEIANYVSANINIDINGNFVWDPGSVPVGGDATNVDLSFTLPVQNAGGTIGLGGFNVHDLLFAGKFIVDEVEEVAVSRPFDQLAAYGFSNELGVFRWIIDTNSDGVVTLGTDIATTQPTLANFNVAGAIPVAGNFDNNTANGDEIGLYNAGKWFLDTNHNFVIGAGDTLITTNLLGHPIVGDFDGDGKDDLAVFNNNVFSFNLANDGYGDANDATMTWGFPGVLDRPIAADMDQDGIDDIGLWVPRSDASLPQGVAQWYFLISNDFTAPGVPAAHTLGSIAKIDHAFTSTPFGHDIFAEFGDQLSLPVVGNFDPPVAASSVSSTLAGDYDGNGRVEQADAMVWRLSFGSTTKMSADGNHNGVIDTGDYVVWRKNLGAVAASGSAASTAALGVAFSANPLAGWTIGDASGDDVTTVVSESVTQQPTTTRVVAVDDFFARLDGSTSDASAANTLSADIAVSEVGDLLLTTLATSADAEAVSVSTSSLSGDGDADEELVNDLLSELASVGTAFDSL